jgi:ubiquitin C-terminal hydrolase
MAESISQFGIRVIALRTEICLQTVDVAHVFVGGTPNYYLYDLNSMVCYYGLHYHAFVKDTKTGVWRIFDDSTVSEVRTLVISPPCAISSQHRLHPPFSPFPSTRS